MHILAILASLLLVCPALGDTRSCACDPVNPESLQARECSLCREADAQGPEVPVFFLKDINPRKPNRWLALPKIHGKGPHALADLPANLRTALWTAAIEKAKVLWQHDWGLAVNSDEKRTQCHAHIHIGKLLDGIETSNFVVVNGPAEIPSPKDGSGLWVHPAGAKLHVHLNEQITETVLLR